MGHRFRFARARAQPEGEVSADHPADAHRREPGQAERLAEGGPATPSGHPGTRVEVDGQGIGSGVHQTDTHLLLVLLGPVHPAGQRRRCGREDTHADQEPGRALVARYGVQYGGREPGAHRHMNQGRMERMADLPAPQDVAAAS